MKADALLSILKAGVAGAPNEAMLLQTISLLEEEIGQVTKKEDGSTNHDEGVAVVYGKNGYTDSHDPRAENARRHTPEGQTTDALWVTVHRVPTAKYRISNVRILGEVEGGGNHVAWVHQPKQETVVLATGYNGEIDHFDQLIPHAAGQEVVLDGKFTPPALGPLAIFLQRDGKIVSDVAASFGLPYGHHICAEIVLEEI